MSRQNEAASTTESSSLSDEQRRRLRSALTWWQEGENSLDYLAEQGRHETTLALLRPCFERLRAESSPSANFVAPILQYTRRLSANRTLNRTLQTEAFAAALRELLYSDSPLPARLTRFLQQKVGPQTASQFLYAAAPHRFPLVSSVTRAVIAPTAEQRTRARERVAERYADGQALSAANPEVIALLADFELYEAARSAMGLSSFVEVNAVLWHFRELPVAASSLPTHNVFATAAAVVREETGVYATDGPETTATEADLVALLEAQVTAQGFTYPPLAVRNYYVALKAKPFVILTGLSGTGKTRLTHLLAEAITGGAGGEQYLLLPVRPDWTDSTALLGYHNLVADRYSSTPFLDLLTRAGRGENRERAFFVCLDEMNLARVEHYLAELLSIMEVPPPRRIPLYEGRTALLPDNVFLTGSVNSDEATYSFSRKVLDRANTIEFTEVNFRDGEAVRPAALPRIPPQERQRLFLENRVLTVQAARSQLAAVDASFPARIITVLSALNELLTPRGMHFGYRVRDEIMRYAAAAFGRDGKGLFVEEPNTNLQTALDLQVVQKVLPRLTGTVEALGGLLRDLESWAIAEKLPRSAAKLTHIRRRASDDGFVTFYES